MLYRLLNKKENIDMLVEINCPVKVMEELINRFNEKNLKHSGPRFVEFINATTPYVAELLANPVLFDF